MGVLSLHVRAKVCGGGFSAVLSNEGEAVDTYNDNIKL